jgi:hypothetical protein
MFKVIISRKDLAEAQCVKCTSWVIGDKFLVCRGVDGEENMNLYVHTDKICEFLSWDVR